MNNNIALMLLKIVLKDYDLLVILDFTIRVIIIKS